MSARPLWQDQNQDHDFEVLLKQDQDQDLTEYDSEFR